ncbi:MAG: NAD(P)/FAD-dependent oxidoreductase [Clostridia bacterium]|nr:NAD(P)/FAD-dependent oxidoreductase [Clostridia bacterium]
MSTKSTKQIAVIGAGAAGMVAAGAALQSGASVTVFEHKDRPLKKLRITGKGRCNLTNDCTVPEFLNNVIANPRFLYTALSHLSPEDTKALFEGLGVPLKTERGNRVFPLSDKAADIAEALMRYAKGAFLCYERVQGVLVEEGRVLGVLTSQKRLFDAVILATGGLSYPLTGSDGSGLAMARALGHTIVPPVPSLVPITSSDGSCPAMQGLSLKNVGLRIVNKETRKVLYQDFGEMMFTHFGLTGPMILSASAHLRGMDLSALEALIDMKPALDEKTLDRRLLSDFERFCNRNFSHALSDLLPTKMIPVMIERVNIAPDKKVNLITKEERKRLLDTIKAFPVSLAGFRPISEAIVTSGGVCTKEINPKTMASRLVEGLYFAGEMIDVDAYTGGFNLQIAFSTGHLAGTSAALAE